MSASPTKILIACPISVADPWQEKAISAVRESDQAAQVQTLSIGSSKSASAPIAIQSSPQGLVLDTTDDHPIGLRLKLIYGIANRLDFDILILLSRSDIAAIPQLLEMLNSEAENYDLVDIVKGNVLIHRAVRIPAIADLPLIHNSSGLGFESELDVQLTFAGCKRSIIYDDAAELPPWRNLSTRWAETVTNLRARVHSLGLLYQLNFDVARHRTQYQEKLGYASSHEFALATVQPGESVFDLGAGIEAYLTEQIKSRGAKHVYAADFNPIENDLVDEIFEIDLNRDILPPVIQKVDRILLLDVIEHLSDPEDALLRIRSEMRDQDTKLVISTPNIAFIVTRLMLLLGQFNYGKSGILDRTHCRLFTYRSLRRLLRQCGYTIENTRGVPPPFPKAIGDNWLSRLLLTLTQGAIAIAPTWFSYQIFVVVKADPHLDHLLSAELTDSLRTVEEPHGV